MKKVYILLSRSGSFPSRLIHALTGKKYTHASISLEPNDDKFYSYGRRRLNNFLVGGLIRESLCDGIFKRFPKGDAALFSLEVSDGSYNKIKELITYYFENYKLCTYNFGAIIPMWLGKKQELKFKMTCSQFVATLLHESQACALPKHPSIMQPVDFLSISELVPIYIGDIAGCHFKKDDEGENNYKNKILKST